MTQLTVDVPESAFATFKQTSAEFVRKMKIQPYLNGMRTAGGFFPQVIV